LPHQVEQPDLDHRDNQKNEEEPISESHSDKGRAPKLLFGQSTVVPPEIDRDRSTLMTWNCEISHRWTR
jgi:hypothetical protein